MGRGQHHEKITTRHDLSQGKIYRTRVNRQGQEFFITNALSIDKYKATRIMHQFVFINTFELHLT